VSRGFGIDVGDDGEGVWELAVALQGFQQLALIGREQISKHGDAVDVEEDQLVSVALQAGVEPVGDGLGEHRRVHQRLKRERRGKLRCAARPLEPVEMRLHLPRQQVRLVSGVLRERVVLVGVDLRLDRHPRGLLEVGDPAQEPVPPAHDREPRDADAGREQNEPVGHRQVGIFDRLQGVLDGETAAVGVPDHEKRPPLAHMLVNVSRPEPGRRHPVPPPDRGKARGSSPVAGQTQGEDVVAFVGERFRYFEQTER
jgi:hypothetical protein